MEYTWASKQKPQPYTVHKTCWKGVFKHWSK